MAVYVSSLVLMSLLFCACQAKLDCTGYESIECYMGNGKRQLEDFTIDENENGFRKEDERKKEYQESDEYFEDEEYEKLPADKKFLYSVYHRNFRNDNKVPFYKKEYRGNKQRENEEDDERMYRYINKIFRSLGGRKNGH